MEHFRFENATLKYHYDKTPAFEELSFGIEKGAKVTLLMDVQSGKSSICKVLCGLQKLTEGRVLFLEQDIESVELSRRNILYLPQTPVLVKNKTVFNTVAYPLKIRKTPRNERNFLVNESLRRFNLSAEKEKKVKTLDGTQIVRLLLCRGFVRKTELVLVDSYLDNLAEEERNYLCETLNDTDATVVYFCSDITVAPTQNVITIFDNKVFFVGDKQQTHNAIKELLWLKNTEKKNETD